MWDRFTFILFSVCFFGGVADADAVFSKESSSSSSLLEGLKPMSGDCFRWKNLRNPLFDFLPVMKQSRREMGEGERSVYSYSSQR